MKLVPRALRNERGIAVIAAGVFAVATIALASIGLGTGLLFTVHNEAQNAADSGALAGAEALYWGTNVDTEARDAIKENALTRGVDNPGAAFANDGNIESIEIGNYDPDAGMGFLPGVPPLNAVRTTVFTDVVPLLHEGQQSRVRTQATAAILGTVVPPPAPGGVTLPIVVGACKFTTASLCTTNNCIPPIIDATAGDAQTAWTSFNLSGSLTNVRRFLPSDSCSPLCGAQDLARPELSVGDFIGIVDRADERTLRCFRDCLFLPALANGPVLVSVPVVSCELASVAEILGWATFQVMGITPTEPGQGISIQIRSPPPAETGGGSAGLFGTYVISLVQ